MLDIKALRKDRAAQRDNPMEDAKGDTTRYARAILIYGGTKVVGNETPMTEEEAKETIADCREKASQSDSLEQKAHWDLVAATIETYIKEGEPDAKPHPLTRFFRT